MKVKVLLVTAALGCFASTVAPSAGAFCGFYVGGAEAKLINNATQVVVMREGQRTVLSMQNNYQGPPENFAMVVPVPTVLQKDNVKVLPRAIFDRVDTLTAPRLVEYWEQDPCAQPQLRMGAGGGMARNVAPAAKAENKAADDLGVKVEAQFTVAEYEIVVLSAQDSTGLDTWLRQNKYTIPAGSEPYLRPYVQQGMKFFVAKVDVKKVTFEGTQAMLSPIRFFYDTERFTLPIRLGLINSSGTQDLIVNILAENQRYEAANYPNVTIPTNLDMSEAVKGKFGETYAALFDRTAEQNPRAVVTEYAWQATSCDPCPTGMGGLSPSEVATLGGDVLVSAGGPPVAGGGGAAPQAAQPPPAPGGIANPKVQQPQGRFMPQRGGFGTVITRLHVRYGKDVLGEDLVFKAAPPIVGGREMPGRDGELEKRATPASFNNFQARYAIRHRWTGAIACENPVRGRWGGPPMGTPSEGPQAAAKSAFAPRGGMKLAFMLREDVPEIGVLAAAVDVPPGPPPSPKPSPTAKASASAAPVGSNEPAKPAQDPLSCIGCRIGATPSSGALGSMGALAALALVVRRRRRG